MRLVLTLVEEYDEGVWSPLCDHNWTGLDCSVVCRELGTRLCCGVVILKLIS